MARRATNVSRARIQEVALTLFATQGYALTSLQEIATALDVTKAALYFYFPAKAQLLDQPGGPTARRGPARCWTPTPTDRSRPPPAGRSSDALTDLLLAHRPVVAWLARDLTALAQPEIGDRIAAHAAHVQRLLAGDRRQPGGAGAGGGGRRRPPGSPRGPRYARTSARCATRSSPPPWLRSAQSRRCMASSSGERPGSRQLTCAPQCAHNRIERQVAFDPHLTPAPTTSDGQGRMEHFSQPRKVGGFG